MKVQNKDDIIDGLGYVEEVMMDYPELIVKNTFDLESASYGASVRILTALFSLSISKSRTRHGHQAQCFSLQYAVNSAAHAIAAHAKVCAEDMCSGLGEFRTLRYRDKAYQRQLNTTADHIKAVRANLDGRPRALQDMINSIIMPQIESAVAYQAGVFLTSYPIFGVVSTPQMQTAALQFETALGDQSIK